MMKPHDLCGFQVRAARALLGWSVSDLAVTSGVSQDAIRKAEVAIGELPISEKAIRLLMIAFATHHVVFTKDFSRIGVALDLRERA